MINLNIFNILKYKLVRIIESNPTLNLLIYNNVRFFKFLLPHEKDYLGMKKICKNDVNATIIDIGANLGISTMGFREMGFKNNIYIYEPNYEIYKKYLKPLVKTYKKLHINNFALGDKNHTKNFYIPYYKGKPIHYFGSFNRSYIVNSIKITFPKLLLDIEIKKRKVRIQKFDSLKSKFKPHFIKIDVEGYDHIVIKGLIKTIKKHKPIILVEYNKENFLIIKNYLKKYGAYIYNIEENRFLKLKKKYFNKTISRSNKTNLLSNRNIYFLPNAE